MISMFYNDVMNIDCSVFDPQQGPRGVSYAVSLELKGDLGPEGVIVDFSLAKKKAKEIIDREIDHRFIVFDNQGTITPGASGTELMFKGSYQNAAPASAALVEYAAPRNAFLILSSAEMAPALDLAPSLVASDKSSFRKALSILASKLLAAELGTQVKDATIYLTPQDEDEADDDDDEDDDNFITEEIEDDDGSEGSYVFHYTHGLQQHRGHCQRMLHGHTGSLDFSDFEETGAAAIEEFLRKKLPAVVHFSAWNEVVNQAEILAQYPAIAQQGGVCPGVQVRMAYTGTEGKFALTLPGAQVYLLPMVPTIENLAVYWFKQMAEQSATLWQVEAYEGIGKGASIER